MTESHDEPLKENFQLEFMVFASSKFASKFRLKILKRPLTLSIIFGIDRHNFKTAAQVCSAHFQSSHRSWFFQTAFLVYLRRSFSRKFQKLNIIGDPAEGWEAVGEIIIIILWERFSQIYKKYFTLICSALYLSRVFLIKNKRLCLQHWWNWDFILHQAVRQLFQNAAC